MSVVIETTLGDITVDLFTEERPRTCMNFIKLCKMKYYNFCLFHSVQHNFIAQTGDPSGSGNGGESVFGQIFGEESKFFEAEVMPKMRHSKAGLLSMVNCGNNMLGSQFFMTLGKDLRSLDNEHCIFGEVTEGHDVLLKLNEAICDGEHRPYQDIRITHTVILVDPYNDPPGLDIPCCSPEPSQETMLNGRIAPDEIIDDTVGLTPEEVAERQRTKEAIAQATILEIVGDLPDADVAPPENVLFVCKLNPVTTDNDLEIIFSRFGKVRSCEVIRDKKTGDSLQYAFVEFEEQRACEDAYFKMDNVLIDDRRIHVDFSQSVSKMQWKGKGRGVEYFDDNASGRRHDGGSSSNAYNRHDKIPRAANRSQENIAMKGNVDDSWSIEEQISRGYKGSSSSRRDEFSDGRRGRKDYSSERDRYMRSSSRREGSRRKDPSTDGDRRDHNYKGYKQDRSYDSRERSTSGRRVNKDGDRRHESTVEKDRRGSNYRRSGRDNISDSCDEKERKRKRTEAEAYKNTDSFLYKERREGHSRKDKYTTDEKGRKEAAEKERYSLREESKKQDVHRTEIQIKRKTLHDNGKEEELQSEDSTSDESDDDKKSEKASGDRNSIERREADEKMVSSRYGPNDQIQSANIEELHESDAQQPRTERNGNFDQIEEVAGETSDENNKPSRGTGKGKGKSKSGKIDGKDEYEVSLNKKHSQTEKCDLEDSEKSKRSESGKSSQITEVKASDSKPSLKLKRKGQSKYRNKNKKHKLYKSSSTEVTDTTSSSDTSESESSESSSSESSEVQNRTKRKKRLKKASVVAKRIKKKIKGKILKKKTHRKKACDSDTNSSDSSGIRKHSKLKKKKKRQNSSDENSSHRVHKRKKIKRKRRSFVKKRKVSSSEYSTSTSESSSDSDRQKRNKKRKKKSMNKKTKRSKKQLDKRKKTPVKKKLEHSATQDSTSSEDSNSNGSTRRGKKEESESGD